MNEDFLGRRVRLQDDKEFPLPPGTREGQDVRIMGYEPRRGVVIVEGGTGHEWEVRAANLQDTR